MQSRILGKTGLKTADIGMGCWPIGGLASNLGMGIGWEGVDADLALRALHLGYDLGVTYFDTADVYGLGQSERLIGLLTQQVSRETLIIGSKVGYYRGTSSHPYHPVNMRNQIEVSLSNLNTDYLDIYDFHNIYFGENNEYRDSAIETMHRFQEEGKIRFVGLRFGHQYSPHKKMGKDTEGETDRFLDLAARIQPDIIKTHFNLLTPLDFSSRFDLFEWAQQQQIGLVFNKPFEQGALLQKYHHMTPPIFDERDIRQGKIWFSAAYIKILNKYMGKIQSVYGGDPRELIRICVQYSLYHYKDSITLCGFKTPSQVEMNHAAHNKPLTKEEVGFIKGVMSELHEEISNYEAEKT